MSRAIAAVAMAVAVLISSMARAATLPSGFTESLVAGGLASPTAMEFAPDGRLFVCEQGGSLRVIKNGALLSTPFLTVPVNSSGERGLLGVTFDPQFQTNKYVYIYYTATTPAVHNRVSRFTANGDVAVAGSEVALLDIDNLSSATNHNGGALHFGLDGKLYIAIGDNATGSNAQSFSTLKGKVLRINKDGTIPSDNPFYGTTSGNNRAIWALGLRNPFTFTVQAFSGRIFINDVGQNAWEEIDDGLAGANYGWPTTEGYTTDPNFVSPIYAYGHGSSSTTGCAITGGAFYNPLTGQFPGSYVGNYFFADYCTGWIRKLDPANNNAVTGFATGISAPVDLKVSDDGSLYYLARGANAIYSIRYGAAAPTITTQPASQTVHAGNAATFSVSASGTPPLAYRWQRDGIDIPGATASSYTLSAAQPSDDGARFHVVVSNANGSATSNDATLTVTPNQPPAPQILQPTDGTLYTGGTTINYSGSATDPEDPSVPPSAFTWWVDFHHDTHIHPFMAPASGATSGSFTIATDGETSANVWYRIHLTVTDSNGASTSIYRDVLPRTATITLATNPSALEVMLDGQPSAAPLTFVGVVGITRTIGVRSPQTAGGNSWNFISWSDGGTISHSIATPSANTTYTATFGTGGSTGSFSDDFNRPDSTTLGGAWSEASGNLVIAANMLKNAAQVGRHMAVVTSVSGPTQTASADFNSPDNNQGPRFGVVLRYQDASNYYLIYRQIGGTSRLIISRFVNGVEKQLAYVAITNPSKNVPFNLKGRASGTTLSLELNGVPKVTVTDTTFATGSVGVWILSASSTWQYQADNYVASVQ